MDFNPANNNEKEPNNGIEQAHLLKFDEEVTGFISWNDDEDYYKLTLPSAGKISVNMSSYIGYVYVSLMDENKNMIWKNKGIGKGKPNDPTIWEETEDLEAGTYYLKVNKAKYNSQNTGVYKVMADFRVANNNDKEPNNGIEQA